MKLLIFLLLPFCALAQPAVPKALVATNPPPTIHVAVRAQTDLVSDWSSEVQVTNITKAVLAWDAVTNAGATYTLGYSTNAGVYTNLVPVGTNTTSPLLIAKTNRLTVITPVAASSATGPWKPYGNYGSTYITNAQGTMFLKWLITETNF